MLLIDDRDREIFVDDVRLEQRVRSNHDVNETRGKLSQYRIARFTLFAPCQHGDA